jgi:hypothetical protein
VDKLVGKEVMVDLQEVLQCTFTFILHLPNPSISQLQRLLMEEDMEVTVKLVAMADRPEDMLLFRWRNPMTSQPRLLNFITRRFQCFLPDMLDMLLLRPNRTSH